MRVPVFAGPGRVTRSDMLVNVSGTVAPSVTLVDHYLNTEVDHWIIEPSLVQ